MISQNYPHATNFKLVQQLLVLKQARGKICGKTLALQGPLLALALSYRMQLRSEPNVVGSLVISDLSIFSSHGFPLLLGVRQARPHPEDEDADEDDQRQHPCHKDELEQRNGQFQIGAASLCIVLNSNPGRPGRKHRRYLCTKPTPIKIGIN